MKMANKTNIITVQTDLKVQESYILWYYRHIDGHHIEIEIQDKNFFDKLKNVENKEDLKDFMLKEQNSKAVDVKKVYFFEQLLIRLIEFRVRRELVSEIEFTDGMSMIPHCEKDKTIFKMLFPKTLFCPPERDDWGSSSNTFKSPVLN